MFKTLI